MTPSQLRTLHTIARASGYDYRTGDPVDPLVGESEHLKALPALVEAGLLELPSPGLGTPLRAQVGATPVRLTAAGRTLVEVGDGDRGAT